MEVKKKFRIPEPLWIAQKRGQDLKDAWQEYKYLFEMLTGTSAPPMGDRIVGTRVHDKFASLCSKGEKLERMQKRFDKAVRTASETIDRLPDERYRKVLKARYIMGMTPRESAKANHYSVDWERSIHREAIKAFEKEMAGR